MEVARETDGVTAEIVDPEAIVQQLQPDDWRLPEEAIRAARQHREQVTPKLIEAIRRATEQVRRGEELDVGPHFFALFLLVEFRAKEALPAIVEAVSLPDEGPFDLFGDGVHEALPRALAALAEDQPEVIEALYEDPNNNHYVRWAAAGTWKYLVARGRMARHEAVARLRKQLRIELDRAAWEFTTALINELTDLNGHEALPEIREAFERDLVETFIITSNCIESEIDPDLPDSALKVMERLQLTKNVDTLEELRTWGGFQPPPPPSKRGVAERVALRPEPWENYTDLERPSLHETKRRESPHVGRNDLCPCGSGKKFKKCCLRSG